MSKKPHTVLVVDDEREIVESVRRTLRNEPYTVLGTTSPREALATIDAGGVDLLVADIDMPDLNGLQLVAKVRASRPEVVRILLTGDASLESALEAINRGEVYRYLTKPWKSEALRETVREGLARLDELRRVAAADRATRARDALLAALETEHPGIRSVSLVDGVHVLDVVRLRALAADLRGLDPLFSGSSPLDGKQGATTRGGRDR
jgi:two-component system probable response regulator PhcQ